MFAYNLHFGGHRSVLVYPAADPHQVPTDQPYAHSKSLPPGHSHNCATFYINLFDAENRLRKDIGHELIQHAILNQDSAAPPTRPGLTSQAATCDDYGSQSVRRMARIVRVCTVLACTCLLPIILVRIVWRLAGQLTEISWLRSDFRFFSRRA